jgi:hypothetical protein
LDGSTTCEETDILYIRLGTYSNLSRRPQIIPDRQRGAVPSWAPQRRTSGWCSRGILRKIKGRPLQFGDVFLASRPCLSDISVWRQFSESCSRRIWCWHLFRIIVQFCGLSRSNCRLRNYGKLLRVSRWKALMALRERSTTRLTSSRLVSVSICLCAFAFLPLPDLAMLTCAASVETECPCQGEGESSKEERVVCSSARRRLNDRCHSDRSWPDESGARLRHITPYAGRLPATIGHQLANGLCAPLRT